MVTTQINFSGVKNCRLDEEGTWLVGTGNAYIDLTPSVQSSASSIPFGYLELNLLIVDELVGATLQLDIWWQGVSVLKNSTRLRNQMVLKLPLMNFRTPSRLQIKANISLQAEQYLGDFTKHLVYWAKIKRVEFSLEDDVLGRRRVLIPAAQSLCQSIGLTGDYLANQQNSSLEERVRNALLEETPFSVIRLGDGEGRVLGYPDFFSDLEVLSQVLYYHFGLESMERLKELAPETWVSDAMLHIRRLLVSSIANADIVGVPIDEFYKGHEASPTHGMLAYACATNYGIALARDLAPEAITGANVFQVLATRGKFFKTIASAAKKVHVIGPWDIRSELSAALGCSVSWIRVPGHYTWRGEAGAGHYPELFRYVEEAIRKLGEVSGELFFVGAGLLGKHYCSLLKDQGGVALDIGSVIDSLARKGLPYALENTEITFGNL